MIRMKMGDHEEFGPHACGIECRKHPIATLLGHGGTVHQNRRIAVGKIDIHVQNGQRHRYSCPIPASRFPASLYGAHGNKAHGQLSLSKGIIQKLFNYNYNCFCDKAPLDRCKNCGPKRF